MANSSDRPRLFRPRVMGAIAAVAVVLWVVNLATGAVIANVTGVPALGGLVMFTLLPLIVLQARYITGAFGSMMLTCLIYAALVVPVPILGPAGFLPKAIIAALFGVILDLAYQPFARRPLLASIVASVVFGFAGFAAIWLVFRAFLPTPAFVRFDGFRNVFLAINGIQGLLAGVLSHALFQRIKDRRAVQSIRSAAGADS